MIKDSVTVFVTAKNDYWDGFTLTATDDLDELIKQAKTDGQEVKVVVVTIVRHETYVSVTGNHIYMELSPRGMDHWGLVMEIIDFYHGQPDDKPEDIESLPLIDKAYIETVKRLAQEII